MTEASIAIAASGREWALGLHRFVADHGGARVRVRVMHPEQALEEDYDVLVIDDVTSFLSAHLVQKVQRHNRKVLGVFEEPAGEHRLRRLGVDGSISSTADPEAFVSSIVGLATTRSVDQEFAELIADIDAEDREPIQRSTGRVVAIAGTAGGVGATEVAVALAVDLAGRGERTCVVDADDVCPTIAQRLDAPLYPNIRTAMDHLQHGNGSVAGSLHTHARGFGLLPGLPNARDWGDIRSGDAIDVIAELATINDIMLVNVSPMVEPSAAGSRGEGRFGVARLILHSAHEVVVVTGPNPMSIGRTIEWLADTRQLIADSPMHVVVNRFEDGLFARGEIEQELGAIMSPATVTFTPYDPRISRAGWEGRTVGKGPFTRGLQQVADQLTALRAAPTKRLRIGT